MGKATVTFVLLLQILPSLAFAQGASRINFIDLPRTAQLEAVTPSTRLLRSSLTDWLPRTEGRNERSKFEGAPRLEPLQQGGKQEQQPGSQRRGWLGRHPALFGALVGAGAGAVSAMTLENELFCSGGDEDCVFHGGSRALTGAAMGAGVGALVGWIASLGSR